MSELQNITWLWINAIISIIALFALFTILITEKIEKAVVSMLIAWILIILQVFKDPSGKLSSQEIAGSYLYHNMDIFAFITWMMILSWIAKDSGIFSYFAFKIVKKLKWNPILLFLVLSYLSFFMTIFISNIPTIIILTPIVLLITKKLKLPSMVYILWIITFANLWWAVTPISDPTTYFQARTLHLSFWEVVSNTWLIMFSVTISSFTYLYFIFRNKLNTISIDKKKLEELQPENYIKNKTYAKYSLIVLFLVILFVVLREFLVDNFWIKFENWTITLIWAFILILLTNNNVSKVLKKKVDFATLFFFAGLFVVVWALEYNWVIDKLADLLVDITAWSEKLLLAVLTIWSALLSVFIDNVPYNIAMVSTLEAFKNNWIVIWPAWMALAWWLNSCTSIGWAGSPIGSACNVIALWQAEKRKIFISFAKYLAIWVPLVLINSSIAYLILYFRYLA